MLSATKFNKLNFDVFLLLNDYDHVHPNNSVPIQISHCINTIVGNT